MVLQTSGPISLLDIQNEFGGVDPISITEYYGAGGAPSSGTISLADFYGRSLTFFVRMGTSGTDTAGGIALDSANNIYTASTTGGTGGFRDMTTQAINVDGTISWGRNVEGGGGCAGKSITVYSTSVIVVGEHGNSAITNRINALMYRYDTSGTLQWERILSSANDELLNGVDTDSSGNIYVVGASSTSTSSSSFQIYIAKIPLSGSTITWQRLLGISGAPERGNSISVDSSGNVYILGSDGATYSNSFLIVKYDTDGTLQWQRRLDFTSGLGSGNGIGVDSSGNCYVTGWKGFGTTGSQDLIIAKYDTNGTLQWQKQLGSSGNDEYGNSIAVSSSGDSYVCGVGDVIGSIVAKYDTNGVLQWQRNIRHSFSTSGSTAGISLDSRGNPTIIATAQTGYGGNDLFVVRLPTNGSKTGTYGNWIYATPTLTDSASSLSDTTLSLSSTTASLTNTSAFGFLSTNNTPLPNYERTLY